MIASEELKKMTRKELEEEVKKASHELLKLRFALAGRQSKETAKVKAYRKYIARLKTLIHSI